MTLLGEPTFEDFWAIYPRRVAKAHALKMWNRLTVEEKAKAIEALPRHVELWKAEKRTMDRIPHGASWLNPVDGRRWEDEIVVENNPKSLDGTNHGSYSRFVRKTQA